MEKIKFSKKNILKIESIFAFLIITTIIFIITTVCIRINLEFKVIREKSKATSIITGMLENINSRTYTDFEKYIEDVSIIGISKTMEANTQSISINGDVCVDKFLGTEVPEGYIVSLEISNSDDIFNIMKNVNISIKFFINNFEYNEKISTVIEREKISECNSPVISESYFDRIGINTEYYNVIPIKYSNELNSYVKTSVGDKDWYNYAAKEWAKVLVFLKDGEDLEGHFISENGIIKNTINYNDYQIDINNYIYIWIPNFSIKDDKSYFRYATGKNCIKMDLIYVDNEYLNMNTVGEEVEDISETCNFNGVYGVWRKLGDEQDEYYSNFNLTKFAPINTH